MINDLDLPRLEPGAGVSVESARIIDLPRIPDNRGNLTFIESGRQIPFEIRRLFYLYDVPGGEMRAGHANKLLEQVIIAATGSFEVVVDDGTGRKRFRMNRSYYGLYIPGMLWREISEFSSGSVCMVLASDFYDETDYHRSYPEYKAAMAAARRP